MNDRQFCLPLTASSWVLMAAILLAVPPLVAAESDPESTAPSASTTHPRTEEGAPPAGAAGLTVESEDANGTAAAFISDVGGRLISGQAGGDEVFAVDSQGIVSAADYVFDPPQTGRLNVPAVVFVSGPGNAQDTLTYNPSGYFSFSAGIGGLVTTIFAPVQNIPEGAQITSLACYYYDSGPFDILNIAIAELRERAGDSAISNARFSLNMETIGVAESVVRTAEDTTPNGNDIYSNQNSWFLRVDWYAPDTSTLYRFYGCAIEYEVSALVP